MGLVAADCTLVIVTKGDRDISEVLASAIRQECFGGVHIAHDPAKKVFARWDHAANMPSRVVAVQDDDTLIDWRALIAHYQPGKLVCNMPPKWRPHYQTTGGICLAGFGAIFDRALLDDAFGPYDRAGFERDEVFLRECDRVFTYQHRDKQAWVSVPIDQLPCSWDASRMYRQARTGDDYKEIRRRLAMIK